MKTLLAYKQAFAVISSFCGSTAVRIEEPDSQAFLLDRLGEV